MITIQPDVHILLRGERVVGLYPRATTAGDRRLFLVEVDPNEPHTVWCELSPTEARNLGQGLLDWAGQTPEAPDA